MFLVKIETSFLYTLSLNKTLMGKQGIYVGMIMPNLQTLSAGIQSFRKDERGNMTFAWGLCITVVLMATGAAFDVTQVVNAKSQAQTLADSMALAASVAVETNNTDRYVDGRWYPINDLGGSGDYLSNSIRGKVEYNVDDDGDGKGNLLARATVKGVFEPSFFPFVGKSTIPYETTSDVAYAQREGTPASIFFVTDTSGSMASKDNNNVKKITSLKTSMKSFMTTLSEINTHGENTIFRTALFPYNTNLLTAKTVDPQWNTLSNTAINNLSAGGGTKSTAALTRAKTKFRNENAIHKQANDVSEPLKFLIFMSDGANSGATTRRECETERVWVEDYSREYWWRMVNGRKRTRYSKPRNTANWNHVAPVALGTGHYENKETCERVQYSPENDSSLVQCTAMKNAGVQIYSIAYDISNDQRELAESFMKACSSDPVTHYKYAVNGADLQDVFDEIGESVVKEVIRIKK